MKWIMVDVEADGPCPGLYSMISLGAVVVEPSLGQTFYARFCPISTQWLPEALGVAQFSREECLLFPNPEEEMQRFAKWIKSVCQGESPAFISDNNGFDWQFVNYYFWKFLNKNPFGHSSTNLGSLYKGLERNMKANFKRLRKTQHTHHPVDDAKGNVEALFKITYRHRIDSFL